MPHVICKDRLNSLLIDMRWKFSFCRECIQLIHEVSTTPTPSYSFILEIDSKLRSHEFPLAFTMPMQGSEDYTMAAPGDSPSSIIVRTAAFVVREMGQYGSPALR
jgi:hypothetical protein